MPNQSNTEFEIRGVNHLALVCKDMAATVKFYPPLTWGVTLGARF